MPEDDMLPDLAAPSLWELAGRGPREARFGDMTDVRVPLWELVGRGPREARLGDMADVRVPLW